MGYLQCFFGPSCCNVLCWCFKQTSILNLFLKSCFGDLCYRSQPIVGLGLECEERLHSKFFSSSFQLCCTATKTIPRKILFLNKFFQTIFTDSALYAGSVIELQCLYISHVCVYVCPLPVKFIQRRWRVCYQRGYPVYFILYKALDIRPEKEYFIRKFRWKL